MIISFKEKTTYKLDLSSDKILSEIGSMNSKYEFETLRWLPWVGKNYKDAKQKILLVAESYFVNEITEDVFLDKFIQ